jgi:hypothetical protein
VQLVVAAVFPQAPESRLDRRADRGGDRMREQGEPVPVIAETFKISRATAYWLLGR